MHVMHVKHADRSAMLRYLMLGFVAVLQASGAMQCAGAGPCWQVLLNEQCVGLGGRTQWFACSL